jgi:apolipoprotein N-acyltransferase
MVQSEKTAKNGESWGRRAIWLCLALLSAAIFHVAWEEPALGGLMVIPAFIFIVLARNSSLRWSFRLGFLTGMLVFGVQLAWFLKIFGAVAICLWAVLSFFTALFVLMLKLWNERFKGNFVWLAAPIIWTGLEYFRSELYPLRFSWVSPGHAFWDRPGIVPIGILGVYGTSFLVFLVAGIAASLQRKRKYLFAALCFLVLPALTMIPTPGNYPSNVRSLEVAGIQLEFPPELEIPGHLDRLIAKYPKAEVVVLSEYTFDGPVHPRVREWCRKKNRYLIAGGKENLPNGDYYNTAFVIGPTGEVVFSQVKSVPIQFFKDGLPAPARNVWNSPWGKIAICVCYDMSYRKVMDDFMKQGAQALIVPFMDVADWGLRQHSLHERVTPVRAREYRIPIFRVGSSGISQLVDSAGYYIARGSYPGQEEMIGGRMELAGPARLPLDHWLAPICVLLTGGWLTWCCAGGVQRVQRRTR